MTAPRLARTLVDRLVDPRLRDAVIGDLEEIFEAEVAVHPQRARLRYWKRSLGLAIRLRPRRRKQPALAPLHGDSAMTTLCKDILHGLRLFIKQPGYTIAAMVTLGLAIGANTLIFTMANLLVLRPLPIQDPDRLGWIFGTTLDGGNPRESITLPEYATYRDRASAFASLSAWQRRPLTLSAGENAERVLGQFVIGDLQGLWGLRAIRGRTLTSADEQPGTPPVVVLSHRFWHTRFGASPDIVGRSLRIEGEHRTVVGVLTADIELGNISEIDVWVPYRGDPMLASRTSRTWRPVGRLAPSATIEMAHAQVSALAAQIATEHVEIESGRGARVGPTRDALGSPSTWVVLGMLLTVVGLLLLLACANMMNLLIARLIARRQELAVRTALGGTRGRLVRQVIGESLVLGLAGGVLGLAIAWGGLAAVHAVATEPFFRQLGFDVRVLTFAAVLAFAAPLMFSIAPTLRILRSDVRLALNDATTRSVGSRTVARGQSALVVVQVTLAVTLLVVAGLVVQSMNAFARLDLGYRVAGLLSTQIEIPDWKVRDDDQAYRMRQTLVERASAIPGAQGAALVTELPAFQPSQSTTFELPGRRAETSADRPVADMTIVSPGFFSVTGIPIVAGRGFADGDVSSPPVAVISNETARRYWGDTRRALGAPMLIPAAAGKPSTITTVIGVTSDLALGPDRLPRPRIYLLDVHRHTRSFYLLVRGETPETLAPELRAVVRSVDADLPMYQTRTVAAAFDDDVSSNRVLSGLFAAFAIVAMLLATAGLYGVMSYTVSQRTPEIAVRIALGATARDVATSIAGHSLKLAAIGGMLGLIVAFGLAQAMRSVLYGVGPADIRTYAAVITLTLAATLAASWIPMRRAARVDPIQGLRQV